MKNKQIEKEMKEALKKATPHITTGTVSGIFLLTPSYIKRLSQMKSSTVKPDLLTPYYEFKINLDKEAEKIWGFSIKERNSVKDIGIYMGGIDMPSICCQCGKSIDHYEIMEVSEVSNSMPRLGVKTSDLEAAQRILEAMENKRYWYAFPFCKEHSIYSKGVLIKKGDSCNYKMTIGFVNKEFGRRFGEMNNLKGRWISSKNLLIRGMSYFFYLTALFFISPYFIDTFFKVKLDFPFFLPLGVVSLIIAVLLSTIWITSTDKQSKEISLASHKDSNSEKSIEKPSISKASNNTISRGIEENKVDQRSKKQVKIDPYIVKENIREKLQKANSKTLQNANTIIAVAILCENPSNIPLPENHILAQKLVEQYKSQGWIPNAISIEEFTPVSVRQLIYGQEITEDTGMTVSQTNTILAEMLVGLAEIDDIGKISAIAFSGESMALGKTSFAVVAK